MADTLEKVNLGMAEFIAKLIDETMEAVIDAQNAQNEQIVNIKMAALMPIEDYALAQITDAEALNYLTELYFPNALPIVGKVFDIPFLQSKLDLEFTKVDYIASRKGNLLGQSGYNKILLESKIILALPKHEMYKMLLKDGLPKIVIDNGEITAKVAFTAVTNSATNTQVKKSTSSVKDAKMNGTNLTEIKLLDGKNTLIKANISNKDAKMNGGKYLPDTKIILENASNSSSSATTSLFGEVTLRFKTVY